MLLEFLPFLVGGLAVFFGGPGGPPLAEERPVGADQVVLEDGHVRFRGGQVFVAENPGCDVHGQPAGNGFRREAPAEIVGLVGQRLARGVLEAGGGKRGVDQLVDRAGTDHLAPGAEDTLEEVREERPGGPLVAVVAGDEGNSAVAAGTQPGDHGGQDAGELRVH